MFSDWAAAAQQHKPGTRDAMVERAARWSDHDLDVLLELIGKWASSEPALQSNQARLALLWQGALLHMDVAMALGSSPPVDVSALAGQSRSNPHSGATLLTVLSVDGKFEGIQRQGRHWEFGRSLLLLLEDKPGPDSPARATDQVRLWYVAAAAYMANRAHFADLAVHLRQATKVLPDDPDVLFAAGCMHEAFGSSRIQPLREATNLPHGYTLAVPSAREAWELAARDFRRTVELRPSYGDARVRLARVLSLLGRHRDAIAELRVAAGIELSPEVQYYSLLFEAAGHEAIGDRASARPAYERALALFPGAQAPLLALSRISSSGGDRKAALSLLEQVLTRHVTRIMDDPWWTYDLWLVRDEDQAIDRVRASGPPRVVR